jgi:glycosyltransferase involved in cell wall biosynthesis
MPTVSVVIPAFRGGRYLREAVASVKAQSLEDWELTVVSDGCEEDLSVLEDGDTRIRVVRQRNRGECVARNVGVRFSTSDLVAFLDEDDRMLPDRLTAQVETMRDETIGLCHTQFRVIDSDGVSMAGGESNDAQYADFLRGEGAILISSTMVRRVLVEEVGGFDSTLKLGGDLEFVYRMARESRLGFIPDVLAEYRRHDSNMWGGGTPKTYGELTAILTKHLWWAEWAGNAQNIRDVRVGLAKARRTDSASAMLQARDARSRHDYPEVVKALGRSIALSPTVALRDVVGNRRMVSAVLGRTRDE